MQRRTIKQCGICSLITGLLRRFMCVNNRRGSGESYYRELGDQETLRIDDKSSDLSQDSEEHCPRHRHIRTLEDVRNCIDLRAELSNMTKKNLCTGRFLTMNKRRAKRLVTRSLYQETALLDDLHPGQVECILDKSMQWKFNAFTLDNVTGGRCLPVLSLHLFHRYGLISHFNLDAAKAWKLFTLIEEGYHNSNPYHNSVHAADVTQAMHCFLQQNLVLCALSFLATGSYQRIVGVSHHLPQRTVSRIIKQVVEALNHSAIMAKWIIFPKTRHDRGIIKQKFQRKFRLPGVIGCIDCTHVAIVKPNEQEHLYFNRKGYHSLNVQMIRDHIKPIEIMASLLAAIAHDMDHPGVNQPFLVATSNHLASLYRNTSVLENHHWRSAISCIIESGLFDQLPELRVTLEKQISSLILATDITRQQEYLAQFKMHLDKNTLDMTMPEHRHLVLQIALKCADISNPCRPWEISRKWSLKVCEEFFRQGDYERKLNLPITALCDRFNTSIPKIQTGFFKFVVTPLFSEWHKFLNNEFSTQLLKNLAYNQEKWEMLLVIELAEETKTEISDADAVEDELDIASGTKISDSAEMLLPLRRGSLNPVKEDKLKEQLRRFSAPLHMFQDVKCKMAEKILITSFIDGEGNTKVFGSEKSIHSQLGIGGECDNAQSLPNEKVLSTENLLPDSSIALITTPMQASKLNTVLKKGGTWRLIRQQTFPPLETTTSHLVAKPIFSSNEGAIFLMTSDRNQFTDLFTRNETDDDDASKNNEAGVSEARSVEKLKEPKNAGSQLRDNLTSIQLEPFGLDQPLEPRRKSMPAETAITGKEKNGSAIPESLRHTLTDKDPLTQRRGSAPVPVAPSEFRSLAALGALRHSVNGGRRVPTITLTCTQSIARPTAGDVQENNIPQLARRSSLPAEVLHPTSEVMKSSESK